MMEKLTAEQFDALLEQTVLKPKLKREVRFTTSTAALSEQDWERSELLAVTDRSSNKGVLLLSPDSGLYAVGFELRRGMTSANGRAQPIICDFCRTWQTGSRAGSILFSKDRSAKTVGFLCCADLNCSQHVRSLTTATRTSRSQLREDLTDEQRVSRLRTRLEEVVAQLGLVPLTLE
jgi:hypothetical protein